MSFCVSSITDRLHKAAVIITAIAVSANAAAQSTLSQNQDGFSGARMDGFMDTGPDKDSTVVERTVSHDYNQWVIDPASGLQHAIVPDTLHHSFHNVHLTEGMTASYGYLGNMGSPRLSRLFFERNETSDFMFDAPYDFWIRKPMEFRFTDTKTPHLSLDYYKGGDKRTGEERLKGYFAANFNYKTGIGIDMDYLVGRGRYTNQSTSMFDARLYTYYRGDTYTMHISASRDNMKIAENGGIQDIRYITSPESMAEGRKQYAPEDIPFRLYDNWNNIKHSQILFNQSIPLSRESERTDSIGDTVITVHVTKEMGRIAHTLEAGSLGRRYIYYQIPTGFYQKRYLDNDSIDKASQFYVTNTVSVSLLEGSAKWAFAGLTAFARHEFRRFEMPDTLAGGPQTEFMHRYNENDFILGAAMEKAKGENLTFRASFEIPVAGSSLGEFSLDGNMQLTYPVFGKDASIGANANLSSVRPAFFIRNLHSTYAWWDSNFDNELRTRLGAYVDIEKTSTRLEFNVENIADYVYLENTGGSYVNGDGIKQPEYLIKASQHSGSLQVLSATLQQNLRLGPLHFDNRVSWQTSSDRKIIPLPDLNVFSDLYFKFVYAKRMHMEIGANALFFTRYDAPGYCPAAGMYHLQSDSHVQEVGGYPLLTGYVNCSLRGVRFYAMYYHANYGIMSNGDSFIVPGYPANPGMFKFGLSWTFFD